MWGAAWEVPIAEEAGGMETPVCQPSSQEPWRRKGRAEMLAGTWVLGARLTFAIPSAWNAPFSTWQCSVSHWKCATWRLPPCKAFCISWGPAPRPPLVHTPGRALLSSSSSPSLPALWALPWRIEKASERGPQPLALLLEAPVVLRPTRSTPLWPLQSQGPSFLHSAPSSQTSLPLLPPPPNTSLSLSLSLWATPIRRRELLRATRNQYLYIYILKSKLMPLLRYKKNKNSFCEQLTCGLTSLYADTLTPWTLGQWVGEVTSSRLRKRERTGYHRCRSGTLKPAASCEGREDQPALQKSKAKACLCHLARGFSTDIQRWMKVCMDGSGITPRSHPGNIKSTQLNP